MPLRSTIKPDPKCSWTEPPSPPPGGLPKNLRQNSARGSFSPNGAVGACCRLTLARVETLTTTGARRSARPVNSGSPCARFACTGCRLSAPRTPIGINRLMAQNAAPARKRSKDAIRFSPIRDLILWIGGNGHAKRNTRCSKRLLNGVSTEVRAVNKKSRAVCAVMQSGSEAYQLTSHSRTQINGLGESDRPLSLRFSVVYRGCEFFRNPVAVVGRRRTILPSECFLALCSSPGLHSNSCEGEPLYRTQNVA